MRLTIKDENGDSSSYDYDDKNEVVIGRKPGCQIQLVHPSISSVHAAITFNFAYFIEDRGSTNGTFVKGRRINRTILMEGDEISVGPYRIVFSMKDAALDTEKTMVFSTPLLEKPVAGIVTLSGSNAGRITDLKDPFVTLGEPGQHAALVMKCTKGFSISQIRSSAQSPGELPTVNGEFIDEAGRLLYDQDIVSVAGMTLKYYANINEIRTGEMMSIS